MATTAAVYLESPLGDGLDSGFYVHYDGDSVGDELREIIARDGYITTYRVFTSQVSRYWREITPSVGNELPEYVSKFPQNIPRCHTVGGYGVLFVGEDEIRESRDFLEVDLASQGDRAYHVESDGTVTTWR